MESVALRCEVTKQHSKNFYFKSGGFNTIFYFKRGMDSLKTYRVRINNMCTLKNRYLFWITQDTRVHCNFKESGLSSASQLGERLAAT
jgi:hypothetical protein